MTGRRKDVISGDGSAVRPELGTPLWWCHRLYRQLVDRQPELERMSAYYSGQHPLPWLPPQLRDVAQRILKMTRTNYMGLVIDSTTERQEVLGFRVGKSGAADEKAYKIWQDNDLDSVSSEAFRQASTYGTTYWLVAPDPADPKSALVTAEHPAQMIVEYAPGNFRRRDAALKVWFDDRVGMTMATLYLPDAVWKFQGKGRNCKPSKWEPRSVQGEDYPAENPLGVVPVVEMRNNPQTLFSGTNLVYTGVSEIADVTDIQDRINKTIADRLVTQDFGAFPQKWATGWAEDDDEQELQAAIEAARQGGAPGQAEQSSHPASNVNLGRDRLVVATDKEVRFGEWASAPMDPYSTAKNEDVQDIAARTRTPSQYLLGEMINISGEALQSAESGLVSKVKERNRAAGEALEEMIRLALHAAGDSRAMVDKATSTIWRDPQYRTIGQMTDAVIKKFQAGLISWNQGMEDMGYTPTQILQNRGEIIADVTDHAGVFRPATTGAMTAPAPGSPATNASGGVPNPGDTVGVGRNRQTKNQPRPGSPAQSGRP